MKAVNEIKVPKLGPNDLTVTIIEWNAVDDNLIKKGQIVCTIETTKSTFEIESDYEGFIKKLYEEGDEINVLTTIAIIGKDISLLEDSKSEFQNSPILKENDDATATKKAISKSKELNVSLKEINVKGVIKEKDIIEFHNSKNNSSKNKDSFIGKDFKKTIKLIGNTLEAKDLMIFSKKHIPHSYIEKELNITDLDSFLINYRETTGFMTLLALLIKAAGQSLLKNEYFNSYRDKSRIMIYSNINIGIVIDIDGKLSVPIIKDVPEKKIESIVKELLEMRKALMQKNIDINNLLNGTFTISALDHTSVNRFYPIIHPKQAAVLALPSIFEKLNMNEKGDIYKQKLVNLGLSYDHSYLNASMAASFLDTISSELDNIIN